MDLTNKEYNDEINFLFPKYFRVKRFHNLGSNS